QRLEGSDGAGEPGGPSGLRSHPAAARGAPRRGARAQAPGPAERRRARAADRPVAAARAPARAPWLGARAVSAAEAGLPVRRAMAVGDAVRSAQRADRLEP